MRPPLVSARTIPPHARGWPPRPSLPGRSVLRPNRSSSPCGGPGSGWPGRRHVPVPLTVGTGGGFPPTRDPTCRRLSCVTTTRIGTPLQAPPAGPLPAARPTHAARRRAGGRGQPPLADRAAAHQRSARCAADADPLFRRAVSIWTTSRSIFAVWPLSLEPRRSGWPAWPSPSETPCRPATQAGRAGRARRFNPCLAVPLGSGGTARRQGSVASPRSAHAHTDTALPVHRHRPHDRAGFTEQAIGHPDGEALTEAAQSIWRGIEVLEGMDRRARPSTARSLRRALSAAPIPAR